VRTEGAITGYETARATDESIDVPFASYEQGFNDGGGICAEGDCN
jgi:hypothetical protein